MLTVDLSSGGTSAPLPVTSAQCRSVATMADRARCARTRGGSSTVTG